MAGSQKRTVSGMEAVFVAVGLDTHIDAAAEWCDKMGARDLEEISEDEVFADFADALQLRPLEKRRLHKALKSAAGTDTSAQSAAAPATLWSVQGALEQNVFVKNTFLDLEDDSRLQDLRRAKTAPGEAGVHEAPDDDHGGTSDEAAGDDQATSSSSAQNTAAVTADLYKTVTCDGYEPSAEWTWLEYNNQQATDCHIGSGVLPAPGAAALPGSSSDRGAVESSDAAVCQSGAVLDGSLLPGPVGMVMVPAEAMAVPFMMPMAGPGFCFPGCVPVAMDRFDRWPAEMQACEAATCSSETRKRDQTLQRAFSVASSIHRIRWTVDARKLKTTDREAVSPTFPLACGSPTEFKLVIRPKKIEDARGGACFRKARGKGTVQLRILSSVDETTSPTVTFRIAVGSQSHKHRPRGPVRHNFADKPICGLPEGKDEWDFGKTVDEATQTFIVCLEVLSSLSD